MKKQNLVWLPFFGLFFTDKNPLIISYEAWIIYQMISSVLFALLCCIKLAEIFS